jgi:uncharacterized protein (TIGR03118 family)
MSSYFRSVTALLAVVLFPVLAAAQHYNETILVSNLASTTNANGAPVLVDPNLQNPWGITRSAASPWWTSNNNSGTSSLYNGTGGPIDIFADPNGTGNFVIVPPPAFEPNATAAPTGIVYNGNSADFIVSQGGVSGAAAFIYVTEDGTISGWNPNVDPVSGANPRSIHAVLAVDNSDNGSANGDVYKGATTADLNGQTYLYVADFRHARVEVYNSSFQRVNLGPLAFFDELVPPGFAPFNVQNIGGSLFVTYAKQDAARHDEVFGAGLGFVHIFSPAGQFEGELQYGPWMNAPWGVVWTPRDFGHFSNTILLGQFGSGWIAAFNGFTHQFIGYVLNPDNSLVTIDGLWSLTFGNGASAGPATTLYFTAGPDQETNGLFGTLTPVSTEEDGSVE